MQLPEVLDAQLQQNGLNDSFVPYCIKLNFDGIGDKSVVCSVYHKLVENNIAKFASQEFGTKKH